MIVNHLTLTAIFLHSNNFYTLLTSRGGLPFKIRPDALAEDIDLLTENCPPSTIDEPSEPSSNIDELPSSDGVMGVRGVVGDGDPRLF